MVLGSLSTVEAATLKSVQSGAVTLGDGSSSVTAALAPAVDTTKSFLVFGVSEDTVDPIDGQVSGQITSSTTVTFERVGTTGAVTVEWYVAEFSSGVSVQRGSVTLPDALNPADTDVSLTTAVDLTRSFPLISFRTTGVSYDAGDFIRAKLTSTTNLRLFAQDAGLTAIVEWQVVEYLDASVQTGDLSFTGTDASRTATLAPAVNTEKSWLVYSYQSGAGTLANIGQKLASGVITNGTTLTFDRNNTGVGIDLTWYLVEFTDQTSVLHGSESFGSAETERNVTIPPVSGGGSIASGGYHARGGRSPYSLDDNAGVGWFTFDLTGPTNLRITRGATGSSTADAGWFVVQFLKTHYRSIGTAPDYNAGTVTATNGSATVSGTAAWKTANRGRGDRITIEGVDYTIYQVHSETELTLTEAFRGTSGSGKLYNIARKFPTLQAWEDCISFAAACPGVLSAGLPADQRREVGIAYKDSTFALAANVAINGSVTDATHGILLTADPGNRHDGVPGTGVIVDGQNAPNEILIQVDNVTLEWLELVRVRGADLQAAVRVPGSDGPKNVLLQNLLIHDFYDPTTSPSVFNVSGIRLSGTPGGGKSVTIRNTMIWDGDRNGIEADEASDTVLIENCSIDDIRDTGGRGIYTEDSTITVRNTIVTRSGGGTDFVVGLGSFDPASTNNSASAGVPPGANPQTVLASDVFVTPGVDLHLKAGANPAVDSGVDLTASFWNDVDGQSRIGLVWDRGADERGAPTAVTLVRFEAVGLDGAVEILWETASELNNLGFHLYRANSPDGPYERITARAVPGLGSSPAGARYRYLDTGLTNGATYSYKLEDVETTGKRELHGPVSATPAADASSGGEDPAPQERSSADGSVALITYGDPPANELRVLERGRGHVVLELSTEGFYAEAREDGTVRLEIPGFELPADSNAAAIPAKRTWVEVIAGRRVEIASVEASRIDAFSGLSPSNADAPEIAASRDGTVRAARRRRSSSEVLGREKLAPSEAARIVSVGFQGEVKKALVELLPLRWDEATGRLVLARRLVVRLSFRGWEPSEDRTDGIRGRRRRPLRNRPHVLVRLATKERGLHAISFEEAFDRRSRTLAAANLRLSRQGKVVAYHLEPDPDRFGPGSSLCFVSEGASANPYGNEAVYELDYGSGGRTMEEGDAFPQGEGVPYYWHTVRLEQNRYYQAALLDAPDLWLWELVMAKDAKSFPFPVDSLATTSEPSRLSVWLQGVSDLPAFPDHHVRLYANGAFAGELTWEGKAARRIDVDLPPGVLGVGENVLEIENVGDTGAAYSMVMLDRFEVLYPRAPSAIGGRLEGTWARSGVAEVSGLGTSPVLLDTTEAHPRWLRRVLTGGDGAVRFRVESGRRYLAVGRESLLRPERRRPRATGLRSESEGADYLLIAPEELLAAAAPLVELRRSQGLRVKAVSMEDVDSEFGFGETTPEALKDFLGHAYHHWPRPSPRYVVLLGDATYDFKDYLRTGVQNRVPPFMVKTSYLWTASDPSYAAVNGDDVLPDFAIGRLPAATLEEAQTMVEKIVAYETGDAGLESAPVVLVADDPDRAGNFVADAEDLVSTTLFRRDVRRIYRNELGLEAARDAILRAFDDGASLLSYVGHGGIHLWASENLFDIGRVGSLSPQSQQPILLTMNCLNGYFHFPYFNSLAEELLKAKDKGAVAAFSPSGLSLNDPAHRYHKALLEALLNGGYERLGDAVLAAQETYAASGAFPELLSVYQLLGDPALTLK